MPRGQMKKRTQRTHNGTCVCYYASHKQPLVYYIIVVRTILYLMLIHSPSLHQAMGRPGWMAKTRNSARQSRKKRRRRRSRLAAARTHTHTTHSLTVAHGSRHLTMTLILPGVRREEGGSQLDGLPVRRNAQSLSLCLSLALSLSFGPSSLLLLPDRREWRDQQEGQTRPSLGLFGGGDDGLAMVSVYWLRMVACLLITLLMLTIGILES